MVQQSRHRHRGEQILDRPFREPSRRHVSLPARGRLGRESSSRVLRVLRTVSSIVADCVTTRASGSSGSAVWRWLRRDSWVPHRDRVASAGASRRRRRPRQPQPRRAPRATDPTPTMQRVGASREGRRGTNSSVHVAGAWTPPCRLGCTPGCLPRDIAAVERWAVRPVPTRLSTASDLRRRSPTQTL